MIFLTTILSLLIANIAGNVDLQSSTVCPTVNVDCNSKCSTPGTQCYLFEIHGTVVNSNSIDDVGKSLSELDPTIMEEMIKEGVFVTLEGIRFGHPTWIHKGKQVEYSHENIVKLEPIMQSGDNEEFLEALFDDYNSFATESEVQALRNELILGVVDYTDKAAVMDWYMTKIPMLVKFPKLIEVWTKNGRIVSYTKKNIEKVKEAYAEGDLESFLEAMLDDLSSFSTLEQVGIWKANLGFWDPAENWHHTNHKLKYMGLEDFTTFAIGILGFKPL